MSNPSTEQRSHSNPPNGSLSNGNPSNGNPSNGSPSKEPHKKDKIVIIWFRNDLRLQNNPALNAALERGMPILFLYIDEKGVSREKGAASKWWLHHSLESLNASLLQYSAFLYIDQGDPRSIFQRLAETYTIDSVFWNRRYSAPEIAVDTQIKAALTNNTCNAISFIGDVICEPHALLTLPKKTPYKVFSHFWKSNIHYRWLTWAKVAPLYMTHPALLTPEKTLLCAPVTSPLTLTDLNLLPTINWAAGFTKTDMKWAPGEGAAHKKLHHFVNTALTGYKENRNIPSQAGTSRLSPHLAFGEIALQHVFQTIEDHQNHVKVTAASGQKSLSLPEENDTQTDNSGANDTACYLSELGWRLYGTYLLHHFPNLATEPLNPVFKHFEWNEDEDAFNRWKTGQTGYPIVDAGMRELWQTGWMHNRVRMIVGSFLVKDLLIPWQKGEAWFWDTLVDADAGSNAAGWQWIAGCGVDAAPYFRIFNPTRQGEQFDPTGDYIRRFVPELTAMPNKYIHSPWLAPHAILQQARITLGATYPHPIVDHATRRLQALERHGEAKAKYASTLLL